MVSLLPASLCKTRAFRLITLSAELCQHREAVGFGFLLREPERRAERRMARMVTPGIVQMDAQLRGGMPGPARIVEKLAAERDQVGLAARHHVLGELGFPDLADRHGRHAGLAAHSRRERHLVARAVD